MEQPVEHKCSICNSDLNGKFCSKCGQQKTGRRVSFVGYTKELVTIILSLENPIFRNLKALLFQPKFLIENYLQGNKGFYFSPSRFLFYAFLLVGLYITYSGSRVFGLSLGTGNEVSPQIVMFLSLMPFFSITSKLTYLKQKRPFVDHIISLSYFFSLWILILVPIEVVLRTVGIYIIQVEKWMIFIYTFSVFYWHARFMVSEQKNYLKAIYALVHLIVTVIVFLSTVFLLEQVFPDYIHLFQ